MKRAQVSDILPPDVSQAETSARLRVIPSPDEKGFLYPELLKPVPTKVIEAIGKIAGTNVDVELTIEGPADAEQAVDDSLLLVAGGYFGPEPAYDDYRSELAQRGKWVATWNAARSTGFWSDIALLNVLHPQILASRTALGVVRAAEEEGFTSFDGSGHSNGFQTIVELARYRPRLLRTITGLGGVGLDEHSFLEMAPRLANFARKDLARPRIAKLILRPEMAKKEAEYLLANMSLTATEMYSAGSCDMREHVTTLRRRYGIPIGAIQYQEDDFFPLEAVERDSKHLLDVFHVFRDPKVRHTGPQEDPSGSAAAQLEVLDELIGILRANEKIAA